MERRRGAESVTTAYQRGALPCEKQVDLPKPSGQKEVARIAVAPQLRELVVSAITTASLRTRMRTRMRTVSENQNENRHQTGIVI